MRKVCIEILPEGKTRRTRNLFQLIGPMTRQIRLSVPVTDSGQSKKATTLKESVVFLKYRVNCFNSLVILLVIITVTKLNIHGMNIMYFKNIFDYSQKKSDIQKAMQAL